MEVIKTMEKNKFNIIQEGGKEYIFASDVPAYAQERLGTSFDIPSYRTIRYYVSNGALERPRRLAKKVYFDTNYIINNIDLLRRLRQFNPSLGQIKEILPNVNKSGEWNIAFKVLDIGSNEVFFSYSEKAKEAFLALLATKKPSEIIKGFKGFGKSHTVKNTKFQLK